MSNFAFLAAEFPAVHEAAGIHGCNRDQTFVEHIENIAVVKWRGTTNERLNLVLDYCDGRGHSAGCG